MTVATGAASPRRPASRARETAITTRNVSDPWCVGRTTARDQALMGPMIVAPGLKTCMFTMNKHL